MTRPPKLERNAGFTLLEALLAIFLMAVLLGVLATLVGQWLRNWDRGLVRTQQVELLATGLNRLLADIAAAEFVSPNRPVNTPVFDGERQQITFVRSAFGPNAVPGLEVVRIAETVDERGPALVRMTAPFAMSVAGLTFSAPVVVLRGNYHSFFSYAGPDRVWREAWRGMGELPRAIRVSVRDRDAVLATSTSVRAEVPARCVTAANFAACVRAREGSPSGTTSDPSASGSSRTQ